MTTPSPSARPLVRILIVDDEPVTRETLAELLADSGFVVDCAASGQQALTSAVTAPPDIVVSDIRMDDGDGLELVQRLRQKLPSVDLPIILMSSIDDYVGRVQSLNLGADDYLPKPINFDELLARIRAHLRRHKRVEELREAANRDELTGVLNRRGLVTAFRELMDRSEAPCSAILVDVDNFKRINDERGHAVGDQVLVSIARTLSEAIRVGDLIGRIGGDEFVLVLADAGLEHARRILMRYAQPLPLPEPLPEVGLSMGCVEVQPGESVESVLDRADQAMYAEKSRRRYA